MSSTPPQKLTGSTNELAKQRNRAAADRTLTSWIQNCLSLIAFGISFDQIFSALNRSFPKHNQAINMQLAHIIGLSTIAIGIFLLIMVIIEYRKEVKSLNLADYTYRPIRSSNLALIAGSIILFGLVSLVVLITIISWE